MDGQRSSTQVYQHKQGKRPIRMEKRKKKKHTTVQNNALPTNFCSTIANTNFTVAKQSHAFTLTGGKAPTSLASHQKNTALKRSYRHCRKSEKAQNRFLTQDGWRIVENI